MASRLLSAIDRRAFLKLAGAATAFNFTDRALAGASRRVSIVLDAHDPIASSEPARWAAGKLKDALAGKGVVCEIDPSPRRARGSIFYILGSGPTSTLAGGFPQARAKLSSQESIRLAPGHLAGEAAIWVSAIDQRGLVYGMLELAERVQFNPDLTSALHLDGPLEEKPSNEVRSVARAFCSDVEDRLWYYDREFWRGYLDALAASRFNRFNLTFGLGYDFPRGVTDDYFHFPYPYLVEVPGYNVQVIQLRNEKGESVRVPLSAGEREKNLEMLQFVAAETALRGLEFQLGLWTHAYEWTDSPQANHQIDGLTPATHAAYCRDALAMLLKRCPQIQGLTVRVHGESGIPEGSYSFWSTLFEAIPGSGRKIEIDMHAKGVNQTMIDIAVHTGMSIKLGAKYSAEHQSLGYNQADIRELERSSRDDLAKTDPMSISGGSRRFTRYGYADYFQEGSPCKVLFRLWPGTQRHLLSADPEMAAAYGRTSHFCGAAGLEICEPLTFKGREGSGLSGGRCAYADRSLQPEADWKKFAYSYRVWGRCLYDPNADPETWRRYLRSDFGAGANSVEAAVANASRLLPLLTSAHLASASNHEFWPELYDNMPIVPGSERSPYGDTPTPKCFATVSPLDPQLFSTIAEHARELLEGRSNPKYSPIEVAQWLEDYAANSTEALSRARAQVASHGLPEFRRMEEDVLIQNGLGHFFAAKLRSGVLFEIYQQTGDVAAGRLALAQYTKARQAWAIMADRAKGVYRSDIAYGQIPMRRGHWSDRLAGIDRDIAAMQAKLQTPPAANAAVQNIGVAIPAATGRPKRPSVGCVHTPRSSFRPGEPLFLQLLFRGVAAVDAPSSVRLHYRHVNQAERWKSAEMRPDQNEYGAAIPGDYTNSVYPLQYYFELQRGTNLAWLYPAFNATLSNQPYYAVSKRET
ncbi:MAG TPA: hypothetical protein VK641_08150 [Terriglobales bacterium]|nr:hypothetical protein [Terriglobales bacterium]